MNKIIGIALMLLSVGCGLSTVFLGEDISIEHGGVIDLSYQGDGPNFAILGELGGLNGIAVQYDDTLIRGGYIENSTGIETLEGLGVTMVISIDSPVPEKDLVEGFGLMDLIQLPFEMEDGPSKEQIIKFVQLAREADSHEQKVYVHCNGGTHRGGLLCLYRRIDQGWDPEIAVKEYFSLGGLQDSFKRGDEQYD